MKITLSYEKTVDQNASEAFEKAKTARKKIERVKETIAEFEKKAVKAKANEATEFDSSFKKLEHHKKLWFEKFKWTITSEGFLVIGGRDATTNEIIIKKHTQPGDLVFHTDMAGSPFVVIKKDSAQDVQGLLGKDFTPAKEIGEASIQDAANFTLIHSRAWKQGLTSTDVFYVQPSQVTKEANAGESLSRGSFVIRGKTTYVHVLMGFGVGVVTKEEPFFFSGPLSVVKQFCQAHVVIEQGKEKTSQVAKLARSQLREETELDADLDEIVRHLPSGGCQVKKERKRKK